MIVCNVTISDVTAKTSNVMFHRNDYITTISETLILSLAFCMKKVIGYNVVRNTLSFVWCLTFLNGSQILLRLCVFCILSSFCLIEPTKIQIDVRILMESLDFCDLFICS